MAESYQMLRPHAARYGSLVLSVFNTETTASLSHLMRTFHPFQRNLNNLMAMRMFTISRCTIDQFMKPLTIGRCPQRPPKPVKQVSSSRVAPIGLWSYKETPLYIGKNFANHLRSLLNSGVRKFFDAHEQI